MSSAPRRTPLGTARYSFGMSEEVFLTDDWIEVDEIEGRTIRRFRVPHDEILLVTQHRERGWIWLLVILFFGGPWFLVGLALAFTEETWSGGLIMALIGGLISGLGLAAMLRGIRVVSIFGERSSAKLRFHFRHSKAEVAHAQVLGHVRRVRRAIEARQPRPEAEAPGPEDPTSALPDPADGRAPTP